LVGRRTPQSRRTHISTHRTATAGHKPTRRRGQHTVAEGGHHPVAAFLFVQGGQMPKPAWYVTANRPEQIELPDPFVGALIADLAHQFSEDAHPSPRHTAAALHIAVEMAGHVGRAVTAAASHGDRHHLDRLITGLNHLAAQLAQTLQRLAYHADQCQLPSLANARADQVAAVTASLAHAGLYSELTAGHLLEAQLTLTQHHLATEPTA
jgi:hypothetical protein